MDTFKDGFDTFEGEAESVGDETARLRALDIVHTDEFREELHQLNTAIATGELIEGNVCYPNNATVEWILENEPLADPDLVNASISRLSRAAGTISSRSASMQVILLPQFYILHPRQRFDAIHIDGGHSEGIAFADMSNALRMACRDAHFIVDDFPHPPISKAFSEILAAGFLRRSREDALLEKTPYHEIVRVA
jgi:hypothetical protein